MRRIKLKLGQKGTPKKFIPWLIILVILLALAIFISGLSGTSSVISYIFSGVNLKSSEGRVNILLLGIAGGIHGGANLTDTIMVASYNLKDKSVHLISIPRDLWLPSLKSKANAVYEIGLGQDNGLELSKVVVGNVVGLPIHYSLRIDFRGFIKAIDTLGGIEVEVERSFDDYSYPIAGKENDLCGNKEEEREFSEEEAKKLNIEPGKIKVLITPDGNIATDSAEEDQGVKYFACRFEHVGFEKGLKHMDGQLALKYVRSRHGTNGEASDFARSKRQQKMLEAIRGKILSFETLSNPGKIAELIKTFGQSLDTDISPSDAFEFYKLSKGLSKIDRILINDSPIKGLRDGREALLIHPQSSDYGGAYVLISQDDDFSIIHDYVRKMLQGEAENEATDSSRTSD